MRTRSPSAPTRRVLQRCAMLDTGLEPTGCPAEALVARTAQVEFVQIYPQAGWCEHDPMVIMDSGKMRGSDVGG